MQYYIDDKDQIRAIEPDQKFLVQTSWKEVPLFQLEQELESRKPKRTIDDLYADINTWRDQQELATVEHDGQHWDADPTSRARIESVLLAGAMPLDYWTDADNVDQPMTLEQLRELYAAIVQQGGRIHDRQRTMKAEVNALTTIDAVQAYPVGWP